MKIRILSTLIQDDGISKLVEQLYTNPIEKYSLRIGVLSLLVAFLLPKSELTRPFSDWLFLLAITLLLSYSVASFLGNLRQIASPTKSYMKDLSKRVESEEQIIAKLIDEDASDLESVRKRLEFERERLSARIGFLVGAIDKLGVIPAVIVLYLTYAKTMNDPNLSQIPYPVLGFVSGIYVSCFFVKQIIDRFEHMILVIESAHERSLARHALKVLTNHHLSGE